MGYWQPGNVNEDVLANSNSVARALVKTKSPPIANAQPLPVLAADPNTLEGQKVGAILVIKHKPTNTPAARQDYPPEIGDHVQLLAVPSADSVLTVSVKNLRTVQAGDIVWSGVFPLGERQICQCYYDYNMSFSYRCVYVDFEKSKVSR